MTLVYYLSICPVETFPEPPSGVCWVIGSASVSGRVNRLVTAKTEEISVVMNFEMERSHRVSQRLNA